MFCGSDFLLSPVNIYAYVYLCCMLIEKTWHVLLTVSFPSSQQMRQHIFLYTLINSPYRETSGIFTVCYSVSFSQDQIPFKEAKNHLNLCIQASAILPHSAFSKGLCYFQRDKIKGCQSWISCLFQYVLGEPTQGSLLTSSQASLQPPETAGTLLKICCRLITLEIITLQST